MAYIYNYHEYYEEDDDGNPVMSGDLAKPVDINRSAHRLGRVGPTGRVTPRYFGVELETGHVYRNPANAERDDCADALCSAVPSGRRHWFWFADDGSVSGWELITRPMGLDAHRKFWGVLDTARPKLIRMGLRGHSAGTGTGLHIHVTRDSIRPTTLAKAITFIYSPANRELVTAIARRYDTGYCSMTDKTDAYMVRLIASGKLIDKCRGAVHVSNRLPTVEFRLFRSSLQTRTVLACLEFVQGLLAFCDQVGFRDLTTDAFVAWLNQPNARSETANLRGYLAAKNYAVFTPTRPATRRAA